MSMILLMKFLIAFCSILCCRTFSCTDDIDETLSIIFLLSFYQVMIKNLEQVVSMVLNSFHDPHPRVRWAAINAIGQLSTDLGPDLQNQYHQRVLPALAGAMDDFQNPRVQVAQLCKDIFHLLDLFLFAVVSVALFALINGSSILFDCHLSHLIHE